MLKHVCDIHYLFCYVKNVSPKIYIPKGVAYEWIIGIVIIIASGVNVLAWTKRAALVWNKTLYRAFTSKLNKAKWIFIIVNKCIKFT